MPDTNKSRVKLRLSGVKPPSGKRKSAAAKPAAKPAKAERDPAKELKEKAEAAWAALKKNSKSK